MATIIDGKQVGLEIREGVRNEIMKLCGTGDDRPGLVVVLVGDNPASATYVRMKKKACETEGIRSFEYILPGSTSEAELLALVDELNRRPEVSGILVQLPLPKQINEAAVIERIDPAKDVDGFHPVNIGRVLIGEGDCFFPCTPLGIQELIVRTVPDLAGKHCVVVGRSNIVGKPVAAMMMQKSKRANCIVTVCHTAAPDISVYTKQADILVVAAGRPNTVTAPMVKKGVVVIDVGTNRIPDPNDASKTIQVGDVDFAGVAPLAAAIAPSPGGVGPMTIAMLMKNTLQAWKRQRGIG